MWFCIRVLEDFHDSCCIIMTCDDCILTRSSSLSTALEVVLSLPQAHMLLIYTCSAIELRSGRRALLPLIRTYQHYFTDGVVFLHTPRAL